MLLGAALGAPVASWLHFSRSLPRVSGHVNVSGTNATLEIVRDRHAVPHIYAQNSDDALFGLGYVHAQDRLWQMELNRRLGSGTLAEVFGSDAVPQDRLFRSVGLRRAARANLARLDAPTRAALDAYARGVNAVLTGSDRSLPPEFQLLGIEPAPWTATDSLVWLKVMAWMLAGNWGHELERLRSSERLSARQMAELEHLPELEAAITASNGARLHGELERDIDRLLPLAPERRLALGSNNWAIDGTHTQSGKPLLANDPHLELTAPSIWYLAHLSAPGLNVIGATLPALPGVVLGRNDHVAWAITSTEADSKDLFIEQLVPGDPLRYLTPDGPRAFELIQEVLHVKGAADETLSVRISRHGPVISDALEAPDRWAERDQVLALSWTALADDDRTMQFPMTAARANNARELQAAARDFQAPQQNLVYADDAGAIGWVAAGRVPLRSPDNELRGLVPAPGWIARYDWQGFVPFEELPQGFAPGSGRIVTANQNITPPGYAHWIGGEWSAPIRAERIDELLEARPRHTLSSFAAIQNDLQSGSARRLLPLLLRIQVPEGEPRALLERLRAWDLTARPDRAEPLLYAAWMRELLRGLYADELGPLFQEHWQEEPLFVADVLSGKEGQERWCDDVTSAELETCDQIIERAFTRAIGYLKQHYGADPGDWTWGKAHVSRSPNAVFSQVPLLRRWFDLQVSTGGDGESINVAGYSLDDEAEPFVSSYGPGLRALYDLSDPERSLFIISSGQSGHPLSRHYGDFLQKWARGEYVPMVTERRWVEQDALGTLELKPAAARLAAP